MWHVNTLLRLAHWKKSETQLPSDTSEPPAEVLPPGLLAYTSPDHAISLREYSRPKTWTHGADWHYPEGPRRPLLEGPRRLIEGKDNLPVVHVTREDATACARRAGVCRPRRKSSAPRGSGRTIIATPRGSERTPDGAYMVNLAAGAGE